MSVRILQNKCVGCGKCLSVCPGNLLKKGEDGKVHIRNIRDCWGCTACLKECHTGAILYFLGADMGGMGSMLSVKEKGDVRIWRVDSPNGETKTIEINMKDSNNISIENILKEEMRWEHYHILMNWKQKQYT